jgi:hypothetical protein
MPKATIEGPNQYDDTKTGQLAELRKLSGISQKDAAKYFGYSDRNTVGFWERGLSAPNEEEQRGAMINYFWEKLHVRDQRFIDVWNDVIVGEWHWAGLGESDLMRNTGLHTLLKIIGEERAVKSGIEKLVAVMNNPMPILLTPEEFHVISFFRKKIANELNQEQLAYALRCSLQHGMDVPFWCKRNIDNPLALDRLNECIAKSKSRRPLLRAGFALERLSPMLKTKAITELRGSVRRISVVNPIPQQVVENAEKGTIIDFIKELRTVPGYAEIVNQVLYELIEDSD